MIIGIAYGIHILWNPTCNSGDGKAIFYFRIERYAELQIAVAG